MTDGQFKWGVWIIVAALEMRLLDAAFTSAEWREFTLSTLVLVVTAATLTRLLVSKCP